MAYLVSGKLNFRLPVRIARSPFSGDAPQTGSSEATSLGSLQRRKEDNTGPSERVPVSGASTPSTPRTP